eukprot:12379351-Karenia_brevis.AAC.1
MQQTIACLCCNNKLPNDRQLSRNQNGRPRALPSFHDQLQHRHATICHWLPMCQGMPCKT